MPDVVILTRDNLEDTERNCDGHGSFVGIRSQPGDGSVPFEYRAGDDPDLAVFVGPRARHAFKRKPRAFVEL